MSAALRATRARFDAFPIGRYLSTHPGARVVAIMTAVVAVLPVVALAPPFSAFGTQLDYYHQFANAGIFVLLVVGLNIVVGYAGLLDLGFAAFFALGAYTFAFGASGFTGNHLPFLLLLGAGGFVAAFFGVLLGAPTLRLRGDYLAIVTFGFGEIVPIVFLNAKAFTGGPAGIGGLDRPELFGFRFGVLDPVPYYLSVALVLTLVVVVTFRLEDSRLGRGWAAIREDEVAAASAGVNTVVAKLLAFALGATTGGFAGVLNASKLTVVSPGQFLFSVSITVLAMIVLGGMGNVWGVMVGAFAIFMIQAVFLKQLNALFDGVPVLGDIDFVQYQFLLLGLALVAMMLARPAGLFPARLRERELRVTDRDVPGVPPVPEEMPARDAIETTGPPPQEAAPPELTSATSGSLPIVARAGGDAAPSSPALLGALGVSKRFGGLLALSDVDFTIPDGWIVGLIGPNGAGKTTFFDLVAGLQEPTAGTISFDGRVVSARSLRPWLEPALWVAPGLMLTASGGIASMSTGSDLPVVAATAVGVGLLATFMLAALLRPRWYTTVLGRLGIFRPSRPHDLVALGVGRTFQNIRLFDNLSALDNVLVGMHTRLRQELWDVVLRTARFSRDEDRAHVRARELLAIVGLEGQAGTAARNLSYGDQRRLELARALACEPRLLLLDEPTAGMNPNETAAMTALIARLRERLRLSVLLIEHDMQVVMGISDRVTVLDHGVKIAEGTPAEVSAHPRVIEAYLGQDDEEVTA